MLRKHTISVGIVMAGFAPAIFAQAPAPTADWAVYGGGKTFQRYSPLAQIGKENLNRLRIAWMRPAVDATLKDQFPDLNPSTYFRGTPIAVNGVLYGPNGVGLVEAFDGATGKTKWVQQPIEPTLKEASGQSTRGVSYWAKSGVERIISIRGQYLHALDAKTGAPVRDFGDNGRVWLNRQVADGGNYSGYPGPFIVGDVIVVGGNGGGGMGDGGWNAKAYTDNVRGYDVRTGKYLWTFDFMPHEGDPARDTWGKGSANITGNMAAWASLTADEQLGYVYVPVTAPTVAYYGGHRPGSNLYSESLLCLDAKTGKLVWFFQMIHHDLWEYDAATPPILGDIVVAGKPIKAVIASNKTGFLYVFDRVTGKPVWPIEERAVPKSDIPGEESWPTQPFPTKPPAYDRQGISESDLIDYTPELHKQALEIANKYVMGPLFTPPTMRSTDPGGKLGTLALPTDWGAGNWNTGAFDPETGMYYAVSMTQPVIFGLTKAADPNSSMAYSEGATGGPRAGAAGGANGGGGGGGNGGGGGGRANAAPAPIGPQGPASYGNLTIDGLPIIKPPYGRITAYDMNKGDIAWIAANGDGPRNHPLIKSLNLPPMGNPGRPAPLLTKTVLFIGDSSDAVMGRAGVSGPAQFRAYDKKTGSVLWQTEIPAGTTGGPMTYMAAGKQFVVVPVGGAGFGAGWIALSLAPEGSAAAAPVAANVPAASVSSGLFTDAQVQRGKSLYAASCASCHGAALEGAHGPSLNERVFWSQWTGQPARALYSRIVSTMPPDNAGSLPERDVVDLVAFLAAENGVPRGASVQAADQLNRMILPPR